MLVNQLRFRALVFHGELHLGELDVVPAKNRHQFRFPNNEIRIDTLSTGSERCLPLSILQTISSFSICCKLHNSLPMEQPHLINLHACCFYELKTAVVFLGEEEIHLVAMRSRTKNFPCFWCYSAPKGLYSSCVGMLNLRCLALVFDLDETLIVANTMKSFDDRIEALSVWLSRETDPMRVSGMTTELKRYVDDRILLKQYTETDTVNENGKHYKVHFEEIPSHKDGHHQLSRPIIRLHERNIVFTRINPENRDTSVLVRLRPAWEELRSYLTANKRKRFEVYVCTMAERDYALEMWRLLDPETNLIDSRQLLNRVTCVKSGCRKSLAGVFHDGVCHPKMAMVIDDRLKVWEDKDQSRVHTVPAFTPYWAPQAETANAVPVLCVARNVACNVRGGFFKEFDENLHRKISDLLFEDEIVSLPDAPDVADFLMKETSSFGGFTDAVTEPPPPPVGIPRLVPGILGVGFSRSVTPSQRPGLLGPPSGPPRPSLLGQPKVHATPKAEDPPDSPFVGVLQEIGRKCECRVEFRSTLCPTRDARFSCEILFGGEFVGNGMGKTRRDARQRAAENALRNLAEKYRNYIRPLTGLVCPRRPDDVIFPRENGFIWDDEMPAQQST